MKIKSFFVVFKKNKKGRAVLKALPFVSGFIVYMPSGGLTIPLVALSSS